MINPPELRPAPLPVYGPPPAKNRTPLMVVCAGVISLIGVAYVAMVAFAIAHSANDMQWYGDKIAGNQLYDAGDFGGAEALYAKSVAEAERLGPDGQPVGMALHNLGLAYQLQGRADKAETVFRRCLPIMEANPPEDEGEPDATRARLAETLETEGKYAEALAMEQRRLGRDGQPADGSIPQDVAHDKASIYLDQDRPREAERTLNAALPNARDGRETMSFDTALAYARAAQDDVAGARKLTLAALEFAPGQTYGRRGLSRAQVEDQDGEMALFAGDLQRSRREFAGSVGVFQTVPGPVPDAIAQCLEQLALVDAVSGHQATAEAEAHKAVELVHAAWMAPSLEADVDCAYAEVLIAGGTSKDARAAAAAAVRETRALPGISPSTTSRALNALAVAEGRQGRVSEAEALFERAVSARKLTDAPNGPATAVIRFNQAALMARAGRTSEARVFRQQADALWRAHLRRNPGVKPSPLYGVADAPRGLPAF